MSEAERLLDSMLSTFETEYATSGPQYGWDPAVLRQVVDSSPELKDMLLEAIDRGELDRLQASLEQGGLTAATYDADARSIEFPTELLDKAWPPRISGESELLATFAHEAQHALEARTIRQSEEVLKTMVEAQVGFDGDGNRRDYTETAEIMLARSRLLEASAEVAAVNVLAAEVRSRDPDATMFDLFLAHPETMGRYLDVDLEARQATPKPGLQFDENLRLPPEEGNLETIARIWYDDSGIYPVLGSLATAASVSELEAEILAARREQAPETPSPLITMDFDALTGTAIPALRQDLNETLPLPIFDPGDSPPPMPPDNRPSGISPFRNDLDAAPSHGTGDAPTFGSPATLGHPDHDYFRLLRDRLPAQVPDTAVAETILAAKSSGMATPAQVDPQQIGVFDGTIWVGGRVPGYRASLEIDQARADMGEICSSLAQGQKQDQQRDQHGHLHQTAPVPAEEAPLTRAR